MAKCPLNNFEECYGSSCEWYHTDKGLCAVSLTANNLKEIRDISITLSTVKENLSHTKPYT